MANVDRIAIVGGGIAGLTLAVALGRQGFRAELIEREPAWCSIGAGIAVQPNGMRALRALGLAHAVERAGTVLRRWSFCDLAGERLCSADLEDLWAGTGPFVGIERRSLADILRAGIGGVSLRMGVTPVSLAQGPESVCVRFSDGSTGTYDLLVGCDGIRSTVRALALGAASAPRPAYVGQMVWRSVVSHPGSDPGELRFLLGEGSFFGLCPVGGGRSYGFANVSVPRFRDPVAGRRARLLQRFSDYGADVPRYLGQIERDAHIHCSAIEWLESESWGTGRVVLLGDAAHAAAPMLGQGGAMAIEDACVLAELLLDADDVAGALARFVERRQPRVTWVREHSRAMVGGFSAPLPARYAALRERGAALLHARFQPLLAPP